MATKLRFMITFVQLQTELILIPAKAEGSFGNNFHLTSHDIWEKVCFQPGIFTGKDRYQAVEISIPFYHYIQPCL